MTTTLETVKACMNTIDHLNESHGVKVKGTKKYTQVVHRMEAFRQHFGFDYGVSTEIITADQTRVVMKASITDADGRVIGTGYAEEIRSLGPVNKTSAIENGETSAIGRALASLGFSGGEYASANEMEAVDRKQNMLNQVKETAPVKKPLA